MTRTRQILPTVLAASAVTLAIGFTSRPASAEALRGATFAVAAESPEVTIRLRDFQVRGPARLRAGRQVIQVINDGATRQEFALVQLKAGKTAEDLYAWYRAGQIGEAPATFVGAMVTLSAGGAATVAPELVAGEYLLFAFTSEQGDEPQVAEGTVLRLSVQ